jgi:hypothetical protein
MAYSAQPVSIDFEREPTTLSAQPEASRQLRDLFEMMVQVSIYDQFKANVMVS